VVRCNATAAMQASVGTPSTNTSGASSSTAPLKAIEEIDIRADEVVRRSQGWACTIIGRVAEPECNALLEGRAG
jgi:hypothetical protein